MAIYEKFDFYTVEVYITKALRDMNRIPEKLQNMACKVKKKQCFTDYVSYLSPDIS
jgi:hypothetical protein